MSCTVTIGVDVTELGNEVNKRTRFTTTDPDAIQSGYGTVVSTSMEAVPLGQCAASLIEAVYIRAVDNTMYVNPFSTSGNKVLKLEAGESTLFRPNVSNAVLSVGIICSTAGSNYEFLVTGQSS
jgi:hypothetical protein